MNFADKVNDAFETGWKSNPQFGKALKEIEYVVDEEKNRMLAAEEIFNELNASNKKAEKINDDDGR